eukprot:6820998-Alexandrium_andersonii.AAC.1
MCIRDREDVAPPEASELEEESSSASAPAGYLRWSLANTSSPHAPCSMRSASLKSSSASACEMRLSKRCGRKAVGGNLAFSCSA